MMLGHSQYVPLIPLLALKVRETFSFEALEAKQQFGPRSSTCNRS
jgi:hypothetical protein